jgi:hypothetical protein
MRLCANAPTPGRQNNKQVNPKFLMNEIAHASVIFRKRYK